MRHCSEFINVIKTSYRISRAIKAQAKLEISPGYAKLSSESQIRALRDYFKLKSDMGQLYPEVTLNLFDTIILITLRFRFLGLFKNAIQ